MISRVQQHSGAGPVTVEMLGRLAPFSRLPVERLAELSGQCVMHHAERGDEPLRAVGPANSVFLLNGEMLLMFASGGTEVLVGGTEQTLRPLSSNGPLARAKAITALSLLLIEDELLDIVLTWDQMAAADSTSAAGHAGDPGARAAQIDWNALAGMFSLANLRDGAFARLPPAHIDELLRRFERVHVRRGDVVVRQGDAGDYYYVVESGKCRVERTVGGVAVELAELKSGDPFGEEALVSDARRNATVIAITDGRLLRLSKVDFVPLLQEPLLQRISIAEGRLRVGRGARWLDVRFPSEFQYDRLPGAINVPLNEVRDMFSVLDMAPEYVVYCQSGRRSSAAAFLLSQRGFRVSLLDGGYTLAVRDMAATVSAKIEKSML